MAKEFKSEYYMTLEDVLKKYDIPPEAEEDVTESILWMEDYLMNLTLTSLSN